MKRIPQRELLDEDAGTPAEIDGALRDLAFINRWFGGVHTTRSLLRNALASRKLNTADILEVAAGNGYCIRSAASSLARDGFNLRITALDRRESHLPSDNGIRTVVGDALNLPFADNAFDFVSCSLFVHHLASANVVTFVEEALRVCRHAVLINDLRRSPIHLGLVYAGMPLFRSRITWNDAPASVRQSYTAQEIREILARTRTSRIEIENSYLYRMAVTLWK